MVILDTAAVLGQGESRGKVHLSHRCPAVKMWKAHRLRRRQSCCQARNQRPICCESCSFVEELPLPHPLLLTASKQIPNEP
jgi:hypothetical protein